MQRGVGVGGEPIGDRESCILYLGGTIESCSSLGSKGPGSVEQMQGSQARMGKEVEEGLFA